jgi:hypothetical protein
VKLPKGPQLKLPQAKPPAFLADLYYDLRDRRLLPLVALVVVAIVAVPFLLGSDPEPLAEVPDTGGLVGGPAAGASAADLTVVEAKPGLRDYRRRLKSRAPTDPFAQRYTSAKLDGAQFKEGGGGSGGGETTSKSPTVDSDGGSLPQGGSGTAEELDVPPNAGNGNGNGGKRPGLTFFAWAIDVRVERTIDGDKKEPIVRKQVLPQTPLPGKETPVVTYMGPASKERKVNGKALLLISDEVREVASDGRCISGAEVCQLLEVTPGFPVVLTYGESEDRYAINVTKLHLVVTGHS